MQAYKNKENGKNNGKKNAQKNANCQIKKCNKNFKTQCTIGKNVSLVLKCGKLSYMDKITQNTKSNQV